MNLKWRVAVRLLTLTWWSLSPAAAAKIEPFTDHQATLHLSNVEPKEPGKEAAATPTAPLVLPRLPQVQPQPVPPPGPVSAVPPEASFFRPAGRPRQAPQSQQLSRTNPEKPMSLLGGTSSGSLPVQAG